MSNTKKILSFIFLALLTLVLVGCELPTPSTDTVSRTESEARKDLETASSRLVFTTGELIVERDEIALTTTFASIKEISFTWTSSNETVIKITETEEGLKGVVTRPEDEDVEVTLSCTIAVTYTKADDGTAKKGSVTETKEFVFTVKKIDKGSEASIKVAKTLAKGETVTIEGVVTNVLYTAEFDATKENTVTGIFVSDETDGVYVYSKNGGVTAKVGDKVAITGVVDYYYGAVQISGGSDGSALSIKVVESGQATPAYVSTEKAIAELYEEMVDGITNSKPTVCGSTFEVYAKVVVEVSGSYTNVYLADPYNNNVRFKVYYKTGFECVEGLTGNSMVEALKAFDGKYVRMPIIPYATDSSKAYCACLTAGKIVETGAPTITDEDLANQTKTKAENLSGKYTAGETVALFTTDEATGATVEWTASVEGVIDLTTGLINEAAAEQVITLTAKVTKGTVVVEATVELTIKAKPTEEPTHAGTAEDPFTVADARLVCNELTDGGYSTEMYYVKGLVTSVSFNSKYSSYTLIVVDSKDSSDSFKFYSSKLAEGVEKPVVGATVVAYGYMQKYVTGSNADLELSGKDGVYPTLSSVVNPAPQPGDENKVTYTIGKSEATITTGEDSTVTIDFGDFEVQLIKNKSTTPPQEPSVEIRVHQNSIFKLVSKSGKKITGFEFTDIHNKKADSIDFSCDDNAAKLSETHVIGGLWQIVASEGLDSISFIASHKQMRLSAITITFE